jgi:hypothetical protein
MNAKLFHEYISTILLPYIAKVRSNLGLMSQTAREAAEAVSDDLRSSACQDAFERALSVTLKDLVLHTETILLQGRVDKFHQLSDFRLPLGVRVNSLLDIEYRGGRLPRPLPIHFRSMDPPPPRPAR